MLADQSRFTMLVQLILFLSFYATVVSGSDWCYHSELVCNSTCIEPDSWEILSKQCNGKAQSPINIITRKAVPDERLTAFQLTGHQKTFHGNLMNNGHSVQLDLPSNIRIQGGNLSMTYKALQLHLHWGKDGGPGSEHTVDGEQFPMEMHIVFIKEDYNSLTQAVTDRTGVTVLGFFFQESISDNKKFEPFIDALKTITFPGSNTTLSGVSLDMFILPQENMSRYFRYSGSLTTPNCSEAVIWTLFESTILLSRKQLAAFSRLQFSQGKYMVKTYRPVQPLNGRLVHYSEGHVFGVSGMLLISTVLVSAPFCTD